MTHYCPVDEFRFQFGRFPAGPDDHCWLTCGDARNFGPAPAITE